MNQTHQLTNRESGKILNLILKGEKLISEIGKPEKMRITEKVFDSSEEALKNFYKKRMGVSEKRFCFIQ